MHDIISGTRRRPIFVGSVLVATTLAVVALVGSLHLGSAPRTKLVAATAGGGTTGNPAQAGPPTNTPDGGPQTYGPSAAASQSGPQEASGAAAASDAHVLATASDAIAELHNSFRGATVRAKLVQVETWRSAEESATGQQIPTPRETSPAELVWVVAVQGGVTPLNKPNSWSLYVFARDTAALLQAQTGDPGTTLRGFDQLQDTSGH